MLPLSNCKIFLFCVFHSSDILIIIYRRQPFASPQFSLSSQIFQEIINKTNNNKMFSDFVRHVWPLKIFLSHKQMKKQFSLLQQCHMTIYPSLGEPLGPREIKFYVGIKEDKKHAWTQIRWKVNFLVQSLECVISTASVRRKENSNLCRGLLFR